VAVVLLLRLFSSFFSVFKERKALLYAAIYMLLLWTLSSFLFYVFEPAVKTIFDAIYWSITTTTTVGYGDITPKTTQGKLISIIVMLSGIGFMGVFLANFTDILIEKTLKRRAFIRSNMKGHVILCGWDRKVEIALRELLSEGKEVVVLAAVDSIPVEHKNLIFVRGEPSSDESLERANVKDAKFVLISGRNDVETLLCAISVKKMNENARISCVVSDPKVIQALKKIGVEQVLSTEEFFGLFLSRSVFVPKLADFLGELMATRGMDVYQCEMSEFEGKTFAEVLNLLKERYNAIAVGVVRGDNVMINPDGRIVLKANDELLYISEEKI